MFNINLRLTFLQHNKIAQFYVLQGIKKTKL